MVKALRPSDDCVSFLPSKVRSNKVTALIELSFHRDTKLFHLCLQLTAKAMALIKHETYKLA